MNAVRTLAIGLVIISCSNPTRTFELDSSYLAAFDSASNQLSPTRISYLQLVGLFELDQQTPNRFGSDPKNEHIITILNTPPLLGYVFYNVDSILFQSAEQIIIENQSGDTITDKYLSLNEYGNSEPLFYGTLKWIVKSFGNRKYLRVWDLDNPRVDTFKLFEWYPPSEKYLFEGQYHAYDRPKREMVTTSMPFNDEVEFVGNVTFTFNGVDYTIEVEEEGFVMFSDQTSGVSTYGSGRYLYLNEIGADGKVILDFNYAYNPPCSYSSYTTCRFPSPQNQLPFAVEAGEKIAKRN